MTLIKNYSVGLLIILVFLTAHLLGLFGVIVAVLAGYLVGELCHKASLYDDIISKLTKGNHND